MKILSDELFYQQVGHKTDVSQRQALWSKAQQLGLPNHKDEDWKYTRLKSFEQTDFSVAEYQRKPGFDVTQTQADYVLVLQNGLLREDLSKLPSSGGLKVRNLTSADFLESEQVFENLSQALCPQGLGIELASGQEKKVLEIVHLAADHSVSAVFIKGKVGARSQLVVIESVVDEESSKACFNSFTLWSVGESAQLKYYQNFQPASSSYVFQSVRVEQAKDSQAELFNFSAGGEISRHDLQMSLNQPGASAKMHSLYLSQNQEQVDYCTSIQHRAPHCTSEQLCKGLLSDRSQGVFNGLVHIYKDAQQTNAAQLNKNLLLSPKAQANTRPRLLVDADDVKATHGATVGQLDPEEIFYLQSRALAHEDAVKLLAHGFAKEVVYAISDKNVLQKFLAEVDRVMDRLPISTPKELS